MCVNQTKNSDTLLWNYRKINFHEIKTETMFWINNFSPKHLWSIPCIKKPQLWTHPCMHCWFRVPSHGDKHNSFVTSAHCYCIRFLRQAESVIQNHLPYFCPRKNANTLILLWFFQYIFQFSDIFKCLKCHCLVLFSWNHLTTRVLLLGMLSLHIHNLLCLSIDLWKTSLVNYWQHNNPLVNSKWSIWAILELSAFK